VEREANELVAAMPALVEASRITGEALQDHTIHVMNLGVDGAHPTVPEWRQLFAETLEKMRTT
jgi:hypothetical protein